MCNEGGGKIGEYIYVVEEEGVTIGGSEGEGVGEVSEGEGLPEVGNGVEKDLTGVNSAVVGST